MFHFPSSEIVVPTAGTALVSFEKYMNIALTKAPPSKLIHNRLGGSSTNISLQEYVDEINVAQYNIRLGSLEQRSQHNYIYASKFNNLSGLMTESQHQENTKNTAQCFWRYLKKFHHK